MSDGTPHARTAAEIANWMKAHLAPLLRCTPDQIDEHARFETLGLDSATAVRVTLDLEDWLGRTVDPGLLSDFPTIAQLAAGLAGDQPAASAPPARADSATDGSQ